jgi:hypothetical protein
MPLPESSLNRDWTADIAVQQCRLWLKWAATQVDVCLADDKPACDQLLGSLAEMLGPAAEGGARPPGDSTICQKVSAVVVAVQSHDRVMQRLTHVAEALRRMHDHLADAACAQSAESWRLLREGQLREFSMAEERVLFGHMVLQEGEPGHTGEAGRQIALNPEDTVELFIADDGLGQP